MGSLYSLSLSRRASMLVGMLYFLVESAQGIFLIPLFRSQAGASEAARWALMTSAMPLVNLAFAGYGSLLVIAISRSTRQPAVLPDVGAALRRAFVDSALVLVLAQTLFAAFGISLPTAQDAWALAAYFLAGQCRLSALNAYIALNGVRRVGLDKLLLLITSSATATLSVLAVIAGAHVLGVALVVLALSAVQAALALGALRSLRAEGLASERVDVIGRRAAGMIWLSQLGGYLNLGIEIPVAKEFLGTTALADFAFASRAFQAPLAIIGLWCQINTPFWAADVHVRGLGATLKVLRKPLGAVAVGHGLLLGLPVAWNTLGAPLTGWVFHTPGFLPWMLLNYALAGMVILIGSHMLATGFSRHLAWASLCGMTAPVAALAWGHGLGPHWFYAGFLGTNAVLLAVHLAFLGGSRPDKAAAPSPQ